MLHTIQSDNTSNVVSTAVDQSTSIDEYGFSSCNMRDAIKMAYAEVTRLCFRYPYKTSTRSRIFSEALEFVLAEIATKALGYTVMSPDNDLDHDLRYFSVSRNVSPTKVTEIKCTNVSGKKQRVKPRKNTFITWTGGKLLEDRMNVPHLFIAIDDYCPDTIQCFAALVDSSVDMWNTSASGSYWGANVSSKSFVRAPFCRQYLGRLDVEGRIIMESLESLGC